MKTKKPAKTTPAKCPKCGSDEVTITQTVTTTDYFAFEGPKRLVTTESVDTDDPGDYDQPDAQCEDCGWSGDPFDCNPDRVTQAGGSDQGEG